MSFFLIDMTIIGIHQPEYLPWLGFFKKMQQCDIFVFFDDVQFERKDFQNRNKIQTHDGFTTLTVPILANRESKINEVKIDNTKNWSKKHLKSIISSYGKSEFFENYKETIENIYNTKFDLLLDLNLKIIEFLKKEFSINTKTYLSSELDIAGKSSERILKICKKFNATKYISGTVWASKNLQINEFKKNGIDVILQNFEHPIYRQRYEPFIPNMSSIDLLFNEGKNSTKIIQNSLTTIIKLDKNMD